MEHIQRTYTVWYWHDKYKSFRVGKTFKTKSAAESYINTLYFWQYIGTTVSYKIISDDVI